MKRGGTLKTIAAAALSLLAVACAKDRLVDSDRQSDVSFMIELSDSPATKDIADGTTATKLYYQVFDSDGAPINGLGVQSTDLVGKSAEVNFQLVTGQTYSFIFWAQTPEEGYYTIDGTDGLKKITANYSGKNANDENFDAFFATVADRKITGPISETVALKRPFAQINIASNDKIAAGDATQEISITGAKSTLEIAKIPTVFSPLAEIQLSGDTEDYITFSAADAPEEKLVVDGVEYHYLVMGYVFAPEDGAICDIKATITVGDRTVELAKSSTPIRRNWRTNIIGKVLTSSADFEVVVDPDPDSDGSPAGYKEDGYASLLPTGPDMTSTVVNVTAANAQYVLDGAYGSIDGKTIHFTQSITDVLVLGRPTRFAASNTKYMLAGYTDAAEGYKEFGSAAELVAYMSSQTWTPLPYYTRAVKNVKFTAAEGVEIAGVSAGSGHIYGSTTVPVYDYVRDNGEKIYDTNKSYYRAYTFENISFEGISFQKNANFSKQGDAAGHATIAGLTFKNCNFLKGEDITSTTGTRLRVYDEEGSGDSFRNIVVEGCSFVNSYQGVYVNHCYGLTVKNSTFTTTGHNAIAVQTNAVANYGAVVIQDNVFSQIGDRIIRFGHIGADTQITITGNTATDSGDGDNEVMKAASLAAGITYNISGNNWGEGKVVANEELKD